MPSETEHGYLVLADISGYTSYVAKVELDHANEILTDLLEVIVEQFKSMLTISKLEGDAVFCNINESTLPRPEALLELIENTYIAFCRRRDSSQRRTTCDCRACQSMPSLELKFFIHHGDYIVQHISGIRDLVGSDVNVIHRLTKNHITEMTGWKAYVLLTQSAMDCMKLNLDGTHEQIESYEHLGDIKTFSVDMQARYQKLMETQHVIISPEEADMILSCEFDAPVSLVWQFMTDPKILTQTMREDGYWSIVKRPGGRTGTGAQNHCSHGKGLMAYTYLDWQPFQYFTAEAVEGKMKHLEMQILKPLAEEKRTQFIVRLKIIAPLPHWVRKIITSYMAKKLYLEFFERSKELMKNLSFDSKI
jgi:class 3 adenylate cyclase